MAADRKDDAADRHEQPDSIELPIEGTLDLHTFSPSDAKDLVADYLDACRERGITEVRIIHGKGTGALRATVHAALERIPSVASFRLADDGGGNWGATIVILADPGSLDLDRGR